MNVFSPAYAVDKRYVCCPRNTKAEAIEKETGYNPVRVSSDCPAHKDNHHVEVA